MTFKLPKAITEFRFCNISELTILINSDILFKPGFFVWKNQIISVMSLILDCHDVDTKFVAAKVIFISRGSETSLPLACEIYMPENKCRVELNRVEICFTVFNHLYLCFTFMKLAKTNNCV